MLVGASTSVVRTRTNAVHAKYTIVILDRADRERVGNGKMTTSGLGHQLSDTSG